MWMRERERGSCQGNKVDSLGDCIMVLPFIKKGVVVEFSLRSQVV